MIARERQSRQAKGPVGNTGGKCHSIAELSGRARRELKHDMGALAIAERRDSLQKRISSVPDAALAEAEALLPPEQVLTHRVPRE